jgi:hypothetical protein
MRKFVRVLLGDLARHEAHLAAGGKPGDRVVLGVVDDRLADERRVQRGGEDEHEERERGEREEVRRRAHAAAQVLQRGPAALRAAQQPGARPEQQQRRQPDERLRPEEHREAVQDRPHEPQRDERDEREGRRDRLDVRRAAATHRRRLYVLR